MVDVEGHRFIKAALERLRCCDLQQDGDDFGSFLFDVVDFSEVAEIVHPHRRPQLSDRHREELRTRMLEINAQNTGKPIPLAPTTYSGGPT